MLDKANKIFVESKANVNKGVKGFFPKRKLMLTSKKKKKYFFGCDENI